MMETPYLDKMINDLQNHIESIEVAVHAGIPETRSELAEYEAIKAKLKSIVSSSSVIKCDTCIVDENKAAKGIHVCGICEMPMDLSD